MDAQTIGIMNGMAVGGSILIVAALFLLVVFLIAAPHDYAEQDNKFFLWVGTVLSSGIGLLIITGICYLTVHIRWS